MMPIPHFGSLVRAAAAPVVLCLLLAGCGKSAAATGPNVDQAGHDLLNQVFKFLWATTTAQTKTTDALFDKYIPCGNGKVKLTYAVEGKPTNYAATGSVMPRTGAKTHASSTQIIDDLARYQSEVGTFSVQRPDPSTLKLVDTTTRVRITLHSPALDRLMITGETDCLKKAAVRIGH